MCTFRDGGGRLGQRHEGGRNLVNMEGSDWSLGMGVDMKMEDYDRASPVAQIESVCLNRRRRGSIPGSERSPGEGNANPLQDSCLENPIDGGDW